MFDLSDLTKLLSQRPSPAYWDQMEKVNPYYHKIQAAFSLRFLDEFLYEQNALQDIEYNECFLQGLRLGAQLVSSLFEEVPTD